MKPLLRNGTCWTDWDGSFEPADWEKHIYFIFFNVQDKLEKRWHVHVTSEASAWNRLLVF